MIVKSQQSHRPLVQLLSVFVFCHFSVCVLAQNISAIDDGPVEEESIEAIDLFFLGPEIELILEEIPEESVEEATVFVKDLQAAIADFRESNKQTLKARWQEDCQRFKNQHGLQSCKASQPEFTYGYEDERLLAKNAFLHVTRQVRHQQIYQQLEDQNENLLRQLMTADSPVQEMARSLFFLNDRYMAYLSGNANETLDDFFQQAFGSNVYMQFGMKQNYKIYQFRCKKMPCIYEYSGFEIERPQVWDRLFEPAMARKAPLFISR